MPPCSGFYQVQWAQDGPCEVVWLEVDWMPDGTRVCTWASDPSVPRHPFATESSTSYPQWRRVSLSRPNQIIECLADALADSHAQSRRLVRYLAVLAKADIPNYAALVEQMIASADAMDRSYPST